MGRRFTVLAVLVAVHVASAAEGVQGQSTVTEVQGLARFEGGWIDLRSSWGPARACLVIEGLAVECFRSLEEMSRREANLSTPVINCSTPLRLYNGLNRTGTLVSVSARALWINLSTYGFDNMTSSYSVGACAAEMAASSGGGGLHYTGCLNPGCIENSMAPGWNNAVSSVYLH